MSQFDQQHAFLPGSSSDTRETQLPAYTIDSFSPSAEAFEKLWYIICRYRYLITIISTAVIIICTLYAYLTTPLYTAQALIKVDDYTPLFKDDQNNGQPTLQLPSPQDQVPTYLNMIKSLPVLDRVLSDEKTPPSLLRAIAAADQTEVVLPDKNQPSDLNNTAAEYHHQRETLEAYRALVDAEVIKKTNLIRLSITTTDPNLSALVANLHAKTFLETIGDQRKKLTTDALDFLNQEADRLERLLGETERKMASFAEQNGIVTVQKDEHMVTKRLNVLTQLLVDATDKRIKSETKLTEARANKENNPALNEDPVINELKVQLRTAEADHAALSAKFNSEYPRMQEAKARVDALKKDLSAHYDNALHILEAENKANIQAEKQISQQVELQKSKAFELARRLVPYRTMEREYESLNKLHNSVLEQVKQAQIASESTLNNLSIVEGATTGSLSHPKRLQLILLAAFGAPLLSLGLAWLIEACDNSIQSPEESERLLGLPTIGIIPLFGADESFVELASTQHKKQLEHPSRLTPSVSSQSSSELAVLDSPIVMHSLNSLESEAFRSVRTAIMLSGADNPVKTILVTSSQKGEGKSTAAANLAVSLAQAGSKALLIDADMRRPTLHTTLNIEAPCPGLVSYLVGQASLEDAILHNKCGELDVILAGPIPPNPAELIGSKKMADLLATLKETYDYIVIDTPPLMPVTDALLLSRVVDGIVLVIRGQATPRKIALRATLMLKQAKARILGVVLNRIDTRSSYYHYYRGIYSYYRQDGMQ